MQKKLFGGTEVCFDIFCKLKSFSVVYPHAGIHAREWISTATVIHIAYTLLSKYNQDPTITHLIDQFDFYILPVFNVDGYVYTWTTGKNEQDQK